MKFRNKSGFEQKLAFLATGVECSVLIKNRNLYGIAERKQMKTIYKLD